MVCSGLLRCTGYSSGKFMSPTWVWRRIKLLVIQTGPMQGLGCSCEPCRARLTCEAPHDSGLQFLRVTGAGAYDGV